MKRASKTMLAVFSATVLIVSVAVGAVAIAIEPLATARVVVDDPPPEPVDCPLCGGNPELHVRRMLGLQAFQGRVLSFALRW